MESKKIIALTDAEHILKRPTMYIGSVDRSEEKVPVVRDGRLIQATKELSVGFYKLMNELVDNAMDEAKRMATAGKKMKKITVEFDSRTSRVSVTDTGLGFYRGTEINEKTGLTNIETAFANLRAGSNFNNDAADAALIGTNGVGASVVNVLSEWFHVSTCDGSTSFTQRWEKFETPGPLIEAAPKGSPTGTTVTYVPRDSCVDHDGRAVRLFKGCRWDREVVESMMCFRRFLMRGDPALADTELAVAFDGKPLDLDQPFIPDDAFRVRTRSGELIVWPTFEGSTSVSFVNGATCAGIHQKVFQDRINELFKYDYAHHFYETLIVLNLPPKLVRFGDQNKTKFVTARWEVQPLIEKEFFRRIDRELPRHAVADTVRKRIEERTHTENVRRVKSAKKAGRTKVSDKYFPPSGSPVNLFIVEGGSAAGSLLQKRDPRTDGVYALRGKVKNVRGLADMSTNREIIDMMNILNLDVTGKTRCPYERVIVAVDADPDGEHILSLLINLFYRWFPHMVREGRLHRLMTPLLAYRGPRDRKNTYFYTMADYARFKDGAGIRPSKEHERYLKGVGSLDIREGDWAFVFENMQLKQVKEDAAAMLHLDIAFGTDARRRKKWLAGG